VRKKSVWISVVITCLTAILFLFQYGVENAQSSFFEPSEKLNPVIAQMEDIYLPIIVNNNENDDCSAIQDAINNLPTSGGQVLISTGTFTCSSAIVIAKNNVDLRGQGSATILFLADAANSPVIVVGDTNTPPAELYANIHISDLTIDGNKAGQTHECWGGGCDTGGLTYIRNNGITVRGVSDVRIERVSVFRARSGGLVTEKACRRLTVQDFTSAENYFDGIAAYETENSLFSNLHLHDNPFAGISLDIGFNHNIVSNAILTDNGKQGIFMRDSRDNTFTTIQIRGSGEQGLFLAQVDTDVTKPAAGNTFTGIIVSDSVQAGMRVNDLSCVDNVVIGAQFINNLECISEQTTGLVQQVGVVCR
jgi:parallel beta-helix repeat protein